VDESGIPKRPAHPFPGLANTHVCEPDDREARQARGHVDLDADNAPVKGDQGGGEQSREHDSTLRPRAYPGLT